MVGELMKYSIDIQTTVIEGYFFIRVIVELQGDVLRLQLEAPGDHCEPAVMRPADHLPGLRHRGIPVRAEYLLVGSHRRRIRHHVVQHGLVVDGVRSGVCVINS